MSSTPPWAPSRRADRRVPVRCRVHMVMADGSERTGTTLDLSPVGLSLLTDKPVSPGSKCRVAFDLPATGAEGPPAQLLAKAVYSSYTGPRSFRVGLVITEIEPQALQRLERLMD